MGLTGAWGLIRDVVWPRGCAGCDEPDAVLCKRCSRRFAEVVPFAMPETIDGEGYACAWYRGAVRRAILGWKDHGDEECDDAFSALIRRLATNCLSGRIHASKNIWVIPAPSSAASLRRRGRWQTRVLARAVVDACHDMYSAADVMMVPALVMRHVQGRSVQTHSGQRSQRVAGGVVMRRMPSCRGNDAIIVDDIVTTGATMRQCVETVNSAGLRTITCLALACTPATGMEP